MKETSEQKINIGPLRGRSWLLKEREKLVHEKVFEERDADSSESCRWSSRKNGSKWIENKLISEWEVSWRKANLRKLKSWRDKKMKKQFKEHKIWKRECRCCSSRIRSRGTGGCDCGGSCNRRDFILDLGKRKQSRGRRTRKRNRRVTEVNVEMVEFVHCVGSASNIGTEAIWASIFLFLLAVVSLFLVGLRRGFASGWRSFFGWLGPCRSNCCCPLPTSICLPSHLLLRHYSFQCCGCVRQLELLLKPPLLPHHELCTLSRCCFQLRLHPLPLARSSGVWLFEDCESAHLLGNLEIRLRKSHCNVRWKYSGKENISQLITCLEFRLARAKHRWEARHLGSTRQGGQGV